MRGVSGMCVSLQLFRVLCNVVFCFFLLGSKDGNENDRWKREEGIHTMSEEGMDQIGNTGRYHSKTANARRASAMITSFQYEDQGNND